MSKRLIEFEKKADYETLKAWCLTIYDFLLSLDPVFLIEVAWAKACIQKADKTKNRRFLISIYRETNTIIRENYLSSEIMKELNRRLLEKFEYSFAKVVEEENEMIDLIIKRGKIRNDREFEIMKRREDEIYADDSQQEYAEVLRNLLADYEGNNALHNNDGISGDGS